MKRKIVFNNFLDFDKEDRWLNEMAAKGLAMVRWFPYIYVFERSEPGAWTYRSGMLPKASGKQYFAFMADAGIETVAAFSGWAIFRKATTEEPFELFSDIESRIAQYQSVRERLVLAIGGFVLATAAYGLFWFWANSVEPDSTNSLFLAPVLFLGLPIITMTVAVAVRVTKAIRVLEAQRRLAE